MTEVNRALQQVRQRIDAIDQQLQQLLNQRAECAQQVAAIKQASDSAPQYYRPEREAQVLRRV
ncbi:MAG TPA: chorismate mutase, partial [Candidatus Paceibacterota bacterium]|nr:chorismate mutase [Candidatus Paceibacterota bacterium]